MAQAFIHKVALSLPIATSVDQFWEAIIAGEDSIRPNDVLSKNDRVLWTSHFDPLFWENLGALYGSFAKFELLLIHTLQQVDFTTFPENGCIIFSTTKGNIDALNQSDTAIHTSIQKVLNYFHFKGKYHIVSNACISGVLAINMAQRFIKANIHQDVLVIGADLVSGFVLDGFNSFQAIAKEKCKPFDADRDGINLGEGAAAIWLSNITNEISVVGTGASNDANHLSGPSRTGEELASAILHCMSQTQVKPADIDIISTHGTATVYNDEMESKALAVASVTHAAVHSLKSYIGHTLGAAGVIETIMLAESMLRQTTIPTLRYATNGVPHELNIHSSPEEKKIKYALKTASGFGGCNAALLLAKEK